MPLSIGTDGEPSARFSREADFRRGGTVESGRRTGTARIRAARRRTASADSSGARGMKLGSASSISWSTSSRGACHSRSRPSVSASGRISSISSPVGLRVSSTPALRGRDESEGAMARFPRSSRGVPKMQRNSRGGVPPSSDRIPVRWLLSRAGAGLGGDLSVARPAAASSGQGRPKSPSCRRPGVSGRADSRPQEQPPVHETAL